MPSRVYPSRVLCTAWDPVLSKQLWEMDGYVVTEWKGKTISGDFALGRAVPWRSVSFEMQAAASLHLKPPQGPKSTCTDMQAMQKRNFFNLPEPIIKGFMP